MLILSRGRNQIIADPGGRSLSADAAISGGSELSRRLNPSDAFTPTQPQRSARRFVGRQVELERVRQALEEDRAHVLIYGGRGHGKTSLANLVVEAMRAAGHMVACHSCDGGSDFESIVRGISASLPRQFLAVPARKVDYGEGSEAALPAGALSPRDFAMLPSRLAGGHLVVVLDEFDRVADERTRIRIAESMKHASDRGSPLSVVLVGVAESPEDLLGRHPLVWRSLSRVPLPLLGDAEIEEIVAAGSEDCGIALPTIARVSITRIARGVPYVAHLLALRAAQAAAAHGATIVSKADFWTAVDRMIGEADPATMRQWDALVADGPDLGVNRPDPTGLAVLQRIAAATQDAFGGFDFQQMNDGTVSVGGVPVALENWRAFVATGIFRRTAAGVVFINPGLQTYLLLREVSRFLSTSRIADGDAILA